MTQDIFDHLYTVINERRGANTDKSYVAKRLKQGTPKIAQKFGEESVETIIAAMSKDRQETINESADMLFHWLLLMADAGISPAEVADELTRRVGISGLDEKAARKLKEKEEE
ncbi:MAG: phosphoribosyl-ATP diphosphatase [Rickettsiales bacterium]|nr:phosphoribosyl-ATP diphosphatase [Rickettsiales bacterium]